MPIIDGVTIITNNAVNKAKQYSLSWDTIKDAYYRPTRVEWSPIPNRKSLVKDGKNDEVGVIAKKVENGKWLIVSVWWRNLYTK